MDSCCDTKSEKKVTKKKKDILFLSSLVIVFASYSFYLLNTYALNSSIPLPEWLHHFIHASFELLNKMAPGIAIGIVAVAFIHKVPQEMLAAIIGGDTSLKRILKATLAGVLLDLCNHGILVVGMKLYKKGATIGQTMAFLIASPWNSLSLTIVLFTLIGFKWTMAFILLSAIVAILSGLIFDVLVDKKVLPANPETLSMPENYNLKQEFSKLIRSPKISISSLTDFLKIGLLDSKILIKWLFVGIIITGLLRSFISPENFAAYFGPNVIGMFLTVVMATIIEVCSEGSAPIAAEIFTKGAAPGNAFTFLMTGVSTDYTEIITIKEYTGSWKISFFLPLVTVPQIIGLGFLLNYLNK